MTAIYYTIEAADLHAHLFRVTLTVAQPAAQQTVSLPVWIPGSYLVREFSKNLQNLSAKQGRRNVPTQQQDKCSWTIACKSDQPLVLSYEVYAFDNWCGACSCPCTRRHRLVPLKKPRWLSNQAVRTELSKA